MKVIIKIYKIALIRLKLLQVFTLNRLLKFLNYFKKIP
jgi:hypothetical protein